MRLGLAVDRSGGLVGDAAYARAQVLVCRLGGIEWATRKLDLGVLVGVILPSAGIVSGGPAPLLANDTDVDGDTLSVTNGGTFALDHGALVLHADGTYTYTLDNTNPAVAGLLVGQTLTDTFAYHVSDGHGGSATATLTITITRST